MDRLLKDLRYSFRMLAKNPGFTVVALLSLALGIGANTSIFTVVNQVLLKPLPYKDADRIVTVLRQVPPVFNPTGFASLWSYPKFQVLKEESRVFDQVAAVHQEAYGLSGSGTEPERLEVELVSAAYFPLLGIEATAGRVFTEEEDKKPGASPVALVSYDLWRRQFGGQAKAIGRTVRVDGKPLQIVGVLPRGFRGQTGTIDIWVPMMMAPTFTFPQRLLTPHSDWHEAIAKLKPGVTVEQANARLEAVSRAIEERFQPAGARPAQAPTLKVALLRDANLDPAIRTSILLAMGAVGFVLLIACVNVANMCLARATSRGREIATRLALGATRSRIIRQLFTEAFVLSLAGGLLGLVLAWWGTDLLSSIQPVSDPGFRAKDFQTLNFSGAVIDRNVFGFTLLVALVTGLLSGTLPSLRLSIADVNQTLKDTACDRTSGRLTHAGPRKLLVVGQIAFALVLLVCAGLMTHSLIRLQLAQGGFDPSGVVTLRVQLPSGYDGNAFNQQLLGRVSALPGITAAAVSGSTPLSSNTGGTLIRVAGKETASFDQLPVVSTHNVSPEYFKTLGIPLVKGRAFRGEDRPNAPRVAIINRKAAAEFWPGKDPIGQRLWLAVGWEDKDWAEVVGIVGDVKYGKIEEAVQPAVYVPYLQSTDPASFLLAKSRLNASAMVPALRRVIRSIDRNVPVFDVSTMDERVGRATSRTRFSALVLGSFAGLALILSAIGIYGVMAYITAARSREIGIRLALGAKRGQVTGMILRDASVLAGCGIGLGLILAVGAAKALAGQLYQIQPTDPLTLLAVCLALAVTSLTAAYLPARWAARSEPGTVLRTR